MVAADMLPASVVFAPRDENPVRGRGACPVLLFLQNRFFTVRTDFPAFGNRFAAHHAAVFGLTDMYDLTSGVNSSEDFHEGSSPFFIKF